MDAITQIYYSSYPVSSTVYHSTYTVSLGTMTEEAKMQAINAIADQMEIYMVWPDTSPVQDWRGWCLGSHKIPTTCP